MAVFRIERTLDYTVMSNHHLKDTALSLKAKGLLSMMLSLPDEWKIRPRQIRAHQIRLSRIWWNRIWWSHLRKSPQN